jgi:hydroxymethylpyrimidine pyrophosphatase-like HAD family hydrolase
VPAGRELAGRSLKGVAVRYLVLATDYDGTIAHDGVVDDATLAALRRVRESGRKLILVSGRELEDLLATFSHIALFDRLVLENGALLFDPAADAGRVVAEAPPPRLVDELRRRGVPLSVGRSILATVVPHEHAVLAAIRDLGLEWHVVFNKGSVMALPPGVTKATGLVPALEELGITHDRVVGVGDAENDHAFLQLCGVSVAVANALPAVKAAADLVTAGARGAGVAELIDRLVADDLAGVTPRRSHHPPGPATGS